MNILSLFDGISAGRVAFERANIEIHKYYYSEIDDMAQMVRDYHYPQDIPYKLGDMSKLSKQQLLDLDQIDWLIGGSSCQNFSVAGNGKGLQTADNSIIIDSLAKYLECKEIGIKFQGQSYLFWEYVRILKITKPK